jgi:hypothetical protein
MSVMVSSLLFYHFNDLLLGYLYLFSICLWSEIFYALISFTQYLLAYNSMWLLIGISKIVFVDYWHADTSITKTLHFLFEALLVNPCLATDTLTKAS